VNVRRLGIFGGAFDPVHNAHLTIAQAALDQKALDEVLFVPSGEPVRKPHGTLASADARLEMLHLAIAGRKEFAVSTLETGRPGPSYTVDTLEELAMRTGPDTALILLCGEDAAADLPTWQGATRIAQLATVLVAPRLGAHRGGAGFQPANSAFMMAVLHLPENPLSSSSVRTALATGRSVEGQLPAAVLTYIQSRGLYAKLS
jgi:nicotinate-nucleotide adenylyltransferase